MISRIRVEVRAASMEEAEREAMLLLDHARQAGYLEGIVPQSGRYTDHHFERPLMLKGPSDPPEPWTELGLPYAGRIAFTFDPMVAQGGLRLFGYRVVKDDSDQIKDPAMLPADNGRNVTADVMVLERRNPAVRDSCLSGSELRT